MHRQQRQPAGWDQFRRRSLPITVMRGGLLHVEIDAVEAARLGASGAVFGLEGCVLAGAEETVSSWFKAHDV
jgi:hypothetical protein